MWKQRVQQRTYKGNKNIIRLNILYRNGKKKKFAIYLLMVMKDLIFDRNLSNGNLLRKSLMCGGFICLYPHTNIVAFVRNYISCDFPSTTVYLYLFIRIYYFW